MYVSVPARQRRLTPALHMRLAAAMLGLAEEEVAPFVARYAELEKTQLDRSGYEDNLCDVFDLV